MGSQSVAFSHPEAFFPRLRKAGRAPSSSGDARKIWGGKEGSEKLQAGKRSGAALCGVTQQSVSRIADWRNFPKYSLGLGDGPLFF